MPSEKPENSEKQEKPKKSPEVEKALDNFVKAVANYTPVQERKSENE